MKSAWLIYRIWGKLVGVDEDRITNLPEEIITHILSFLPTKDAVRCSVLSTKWTHLWKNLTNLHFDDHLSSAMGEKNFINSVKTATFASNSILHTFKLNCSGRYDTDLVHSCISKAIRRKVRRLEILWTGLLYSSVYFSSLYKFYRGIDTDSLTELKLQMYFNTVYIPTPVRFSSLKILDANIMFTKDSTFSNDDSSSELNFSFPLLELLSLYKCTWKDVEVANVVAPLLKSFSLTDLPSLMSRDCLIKIHGSSIIKFEYSGSYVAGFNLGMSSVTHATINLLLFGVEDLKHEIALRACTLLTQFSSLQYLTLSSTTIEALGCVEDLQDRLSTYDNMIHLTISDRKLPICVETFITLLQILPVQSLFFSLELPHFKDDSMLQEVEFSCSLPHLKVVKFGVFNGEKCMLTLTKFLLKNAMNLEEMTTIAGSDLRYYCSNIEIDSIEEVTEQSLLNWSKSLIQFAVQLLSGVASCLLLLYLTSLYPSLIKVAISRA